MNAPTTIFGGAQLIARIDNGYCAASDHRKDGQAVGFYQKMGFAKPSKCVGMWIYSGQDHD